MKNPLRLWACGGFFCISKSISDMCVRIAMHPKADTSVFASTVPDDRHEPHIACLVYYTMITDFVYSLRI